MWCTKDLTLVGSTKNVSMSAAVFGNAFVVARLWRCKDFLAWSSVLPAKPAMSPKTPPPGTELCEVLSHPRMRWM